jgi:K+-sensing histidine kinase KdpD
MQDNASAFRIPQRIIMEAERLNLIDTTLADLARRADELRGYL